MAVTSFANVAAKDEVGLKWLSRGTSAPGAIVDPLQLDLHGGSWIEESGMVSRGRHPVLGEVT